MKIVHINSVFKIGSTGGLVKSMHDFLRSNGHESYVLYGRKQVDSYEGTYFIGSNLEFILHVMLTRIFDRHGFGSKKTTLRYIEMLEKIDPDIIHLHNIHGYYLNIELLFNYFKKANKKIVWTIHDCWPITGHCAYFEEANCNKWKSMCGECSLKSDYPSSFGFSKSSKNYIAKTDLFKLDSQINVVSISKWLNSVLKQSLLKDNSIWCIYNGIDTDLFKSSNTEYFTNRGFENKYIILGVASQWSERKGFNRFVELSNKLSDDELIVLIGSNKSKHKDVPRNIMLIDHLDEPHMIVEAYSSADVFVNMSTEETFGLVTVEAMACGTPAIVFDSSASPELLTEQVGRVVKKNDITEVYQAIQELRNTDKKEVKGNCENHVKTNFSKRVMLNKYLELYQYIISK